MPAAAKTFQFRDAVVKSVNRDKRTIEFVVNDDSLDSQGHRVKQEGINWKQFKRNPVILACHNDRSFAVAKGISDSIRIVETPTGKQTRMTIEFPEEGKVPESDTAFYLYANGFMQAVSIGIWNLEYEMTEEEDGNGVVLPVTLIHKCDAFEVSLVAIPANDNALAVRAKKMNTDVEKIRKVAREFEGLMEAKVGSQSLDGPTSGTLDAMSETSVTENAISKGFTVETIDGLLELMGDCELKKDLTDRWGYFDRKQPANKVSTKTLEKFFRARGETQPADEVAAWKLMGEILESEEKAEEPKEEVKVEPVAEEKVEEKVEVAVEEKPEEPKEAPVETKVEEPPAPSNPIAPVEAAPQPEQKSAAAPQKKTVRITLAALRELPGVLGEAYARRAVAALQRGTPVKDLDGILDEAEKSLLSSLIS